MLVYAFDRHSTPVHIDEIASGAGKPDFRCPACLSRVIPHCGPKVTHHFKHQPGAECVAEGGEGAWHLSAKVHLERILTGMIDNRDALMVSVQCPCSRSSVQPMVVFEWGDRVILERSIGAYRPDLVVMRCNREILRVEVLVTNACTVFPLSRLTLLAS